MAEDNLSTLSVEKKEVGSNQERYLEFSLGQEYYAVPLLRVKEVIAVPSTTPIPHAPSYFEGIMNLRGQVISIVDLRKKLGVKKIDDNKEEAVIIVDLNPIYLGVIVDSVSTVLALRDDEVCPPPNADTKTKTDYITGVRFHDKKMTVMMDIGKVLNIKDYQTLSQEKASA